MNGLRRITVSSPKSSRTSSPPWLGIAVNLGESSSTSGVPSLVQNLMISSSKRWPHSGQYLISDGWGLAGQTSQERYILTRICNGNDAQKRPLREAAPPDRRLPACVYSNHAGRRPALRQRLIRLQAPGPLVGLPLVVRRLFRSVFPLPRLHNRRAASRSPLPTSDPTPFHRRRS